MLKVIEGIEAQIRQLEDRFKKNSDYAAQCASSIEKLAADKLSALKDCDIVTGAIQAYRNSVNEMRSKLGMAEKVATDVATVVGEVADAVKTVEGVVDAVSGQGN